MRRLDSKLYSCDFMYKIYVDKKDVLGWIYSLWIYLYYFSLYKHNVQILFQF